MQFWHYNVKPRRLRYGAGVRIISLQLAAITHALIVSYFFACLPPPAPVTSTTFPSYDRDIPAKLYSPCRTAANSVATGPPATSLTAGRVNFSSSSTSALLGGGAGSDQSEGVNRGFVTTDFATWGAHGNKLKYGELRDTKLILSQIIFDCLF